MKSIKNYTKEELLKVASNFNITNRSKMKKLELYNALYQNIKKNFNPVKDYKGSICYLDNAHISGFTLEDSRSTLIEQFNVHSYTKIKKEELQTNVYNKYFQRLIFVLEMDNKKIEFYENREKIMYVVLKIDTVFGFIAPNYINTDDIFLK